MALFTKRLIKTISVDIKVDKRLEKCTRLLAKPYKCIIFSLFSNNNSISIIIRNNKLIEI